MRWLVWVVLGISALGWAEVGAVRLERADRGDRLRQSSALVNYAFFEFAPASGAGMGTACACTTPTGAQGEVLTFTRASSGTCLKGNTTTGIANGDMVTCSSNQPRVMPGGDGSGGNGLLVEGARTNSLLRSEEVDNAAWLKGNDGTSSNPVVTANAAVAPDGTTTADRVEFPATTAAQRSFAAQSASLSGSSASSFFIKGNGTSGTLQIANWNGSAYVCTTCSFVASTWTRCINTFAGAATSNTVIGNIGDAPLCNDGAHAAQDVFLWGIQMEVGAFASSYIKTEGAAVTRAAEVVNFPLVLANDTGSAAATIIPPRTGYGDSNDHGIVALSTTGPLSFRFLLDYDSAGTPRIATYTNFGAGGSIQSAYTVTAGIPERFAMWWDATTRNVISPTGSNSDAIPVGTKNSTVVEIGEYSSAGTTVGQIQAVVKRVCVDPSPTRCR